MEKVIKLIRKAINGDRTNCELLANGNRIGTVRTFTTFEKASFASVYRNKEVSMAEVRFDDRNISSPIKCRPSEVTRKASEVVRAAFSADCVSFASYKC